MKLDRAQWDYESMVADINGDPRLTIRSSLENEENAAYRWRALKCVPIYGFGDSYSLLISIHPFYLVRGCNIETK